jgi:hypothetical protein
VRYIAWVGMTLYLAVLLPVENHLKVAFFFSAVVVSIIAFVLKIYDPKK